MISYFIDTLIQSYRKDYYDEDVQELIPRLLHGSAQSSTLKTLRTGLGLEWEETYDVVVPYGDNRQSRFETVWYFELSHDHVIYYKAGEQSGQLSLEILRQHLGPIAFDEFEKHDFSRATSIDIASNFPPPYWEPSFHVPERKIAFTGRLLEDLNFQWRHVLRHPYNDVTFRKFVEAVLHITTFDVEVEELTESRQGIGRAYVDPLDLPQWGSLEARIIRMGRTWLVSSPDCVQGLTLAKEHRNEHRVDQDSASPSNYLIMTIRHILLCRISKGRWEWTRPLPFLNGKEPVIKGAVEMMLAACSQTPINTPIHRIPIELQSRILRYVSQGPVEAARMGCVLGIGLPFAWKDGKMDVERETAHRNRHSGSPVESQICFSGHFSGISYKGDVATISGEKDTHYMGYTGWVQR